MKHVKTNTQFTAIHWLRLASMQHFKKLNKILKYIETTEK